MRKAGELFGELWAESFLEGVFYLSETEFLRRREAFSCCFLAEGRSHSLEQRTRERDLLSWREG